MQQIINTTEDKYLYRTNLILHSVTPTILESKTKVLGVSKYTHTCLVNDMAVVSCSEI